MKKLLPLLLLFLMFTGCGEPKKNTSTIFAMDTVMTLTVYGSHTEALTHSAGEISRLEQMLSVTAPGSELSRLNQGENALSPETAGLISNALDIAGMTGGAYDPTVYPLMAQWGFYDDEFSVPEGETLQTALSHTGYEHVTQDAEGIHLPQDMGLDLGGIAKGYAAQQVLDLMEKDGVASAVISLGGNVGLLGSKPDGTDWIVAVETPDGSGQPIGQLSIPGGKKTYVVTSGAYQRYFEVDGVRYHHILNPATGFPAETDLLSVTIVSHNGPQADALSTALFVMGYDRAVEFWQSGTYNFDMVLITDTGISVTPGAALTSDQPITLLEDTK